MNKYTPLTQAEAERLIDQYYDGETTREEEVRLAAFLAQDNIPGRYAAEKALFAYFVAEKTAQVEPPLVESPSEWPRYAEPDARPSLRPPQGRHRIFRPMVAWSFAAAAVLAGVFILDSVNKPEHGIAYVDGVACTDQRTMKEMAMASIREVGLGSDDVAGAVNPMNDHDLIDAQLEFLSEQ